MNITKFTAKPFYQALISNIQQICKDNNVDDSHGLSHSIKIGSETEKALQTESTINQIIKQNIILAGYLHDIDDRKYFLTKGCKNAQKVLINLNIPNERQRDIIQMIELVSFSKNGNNISPEIPMNYYLPRYVDRSEAIGIQGLYRSYEFNLSRQTRLPLFNKNTPKPRNIQQALEISQGRDIKYMETGESETVVDHFFDKLIHIKLPNQIGNLYLKILFQTKLQEMIHFIIANAAENYENYERNLLQQYRKNSKTW